MATAAAAQSLPEGPGRATVVTACATACPGAGPIAPLRLSRQQWETIVDEMVARGADIAAADVKVVVEYLATRQGKPRRILVHAGKTGFLYILDRTNGTPLIGIEERPVPQERRMKTAATQPYPIGDSFVPICPKPGSVPAGYKSSCMFGAYWDEPIVMTPGTQGGVSWAPIAYSPDTGLV